MPYLHFINDKQCPHCKAVANFQLLCAAQVTSLVTIHPHKRGWQHDNNQWRALFYCLQCRSAVFASFQSSMGLAEFNLMRPVLASNTLGMAQTPAMAINAVHYGIDLSLRVTHFQWSEPESIRIPQGLPVNIQESFADLIEVAANAKYAAAACRSILDMICRDKLALESSKRMSLFELIEQLKAKGEITAPLCELAHHTRQQGNAALHEGTRPSQAEAEEAIRLTTMIAEQVYELRYRIL